ncbi:Mismatch repair endonuclease pms2, partial [Nowakowskiella sp. JEL0078]
MKIERISQESVHRICSGQVILDLATATKELIENSLDAKATTIEVRLKEYGLDGIEVIALKHHTSKITNFNDVSQVRTFGFRGEALSSMCAISDLIVTTSRECDTPYAVRLEFDHEGHIRKKLNVARSKGTTVAITNIFENWPVRSSEMRRNIKKEYAKCLEIVQEYALISNGVRITCISLVKNQRTVVLSSSGISLRDNFCSVFNTKMSLVSTFRFKIDLGSSLESIRDSEISLGVEEDSENSIETTEDTKISCDSFITGIASKPIHGHGRNTNDRQFLFINSRPVNYSKLQKSVSEVYRSICSQHPILVLNLELPTDAYDVNVTPDKRTVLVHQERFLLEKIRSHFEEFWQVRTSATVPIAIPTPSQFSSSTKLDYSPSTTTSATLSKHTFSEIFIPSKKNSNAKASNPVFNNQESEKKISDDNNISTGKVNLNPKSESIPVKNFVDTTIMDVDSTNPVDCALEDWANTLLGVTPTLPTPVFLALQDHDSTSLRSRWDKMMYETRSLPDVSVEISKLVRPKRKRKVVKTRVESKEVGEIDSVAAEAELGKVLQKEDFDEMQVVGQFNLGFIVVKKADDLFIVDQHA